MRMTTNRWSPDTCQCVLEYTFDADAPAEERVHTPSNHVKKCSAHALTPNKETAYETVLEENRRKNRALDEVKKQLTPEHAEKVSYRFDENRELVITLPEEEKGKKNLISVSLTKVKLE